MLTDTRTHTHTKIAFRHTAYHQKNENHMHLMLSACAREIEDTTAIVRVIISGSEEVYSKIVLHSLRSDHFPNESASV